MNPWNVAVQKTTDESSSDTFTRGTPQRTTEEEKNRFKSTKRTLKRKGLQSDGQEGSRPIFNGHLSLGESCESANEEPSGPSKARKKREGKKATVEKRLFGNQRS